MRLLRLAALASIALILLAATAAADAGLRWRRTSPHALIASRGGELLLEVTGGRARGAQSTPIQLEPSDPYRAQVELSVPEDAHARGAFLRIALYAHADGSGRQALRFDAPLVTSGTRAERTIDFAAPSWAHAAKLRVLVRPDPGSVEPVAPVRARVIAVRAIPPERPLPEVVLREPD